MHGARSMLGRRSAFQHGKRNAGSLDPVLAVGLRQALPLASASSTRSRH